MVFFSETIAYSERVGKDLYAPFVKPNFYESCNFKHKDQRPLEKITKAGSVAEVRHSFPPRSKSYMINQSINDRGGK